MKQGLMNEEKKELIKVSNEVKTLVEDRAYEACDLLLRKMIGKYPHAPEPHNLFGILLEKEGNHLVAMKHFRAAWALDPTYLPARFNLAQYTSFFATGAVAFNEGDCPELVEDCPGHVAYDENGIGHIVRRRR